MRVPAEMTTDGWVWAKYRDYLFGTGSGVPILSLVMYASGIAMLVSLLPNGVGRTEGGILIFGVLGMWRYSWWLLHHVRSIIYTAIRYPALRRSAVKSWEEGIRPERIWFQMTTYHEDPQTTREVLTSILSEVRLIGVRATLIVGVGAEEDEEVINGFFAGADCPEGFDYRLVRQTNPGKRNAIADVLREMAMLKPGPEPVVFMDGDSILGEGAVFKCVQMMMVDSRVRGITTNERAIVKGSEFVQNFLHMRFAVRDVHMRSMALSRRLTALTGRMSVLRADDVVNPDFIAVIENDYLEHWFWGRFRFLSGDDKSSWFYLLTRGADFLYVPDATVYTIERVEDGRPLERIKQNLMRWSGNMLRSGTRAIPLGPRRLGFYLWWCLIDQRIAIWTSLIGLCCGLLFALAGRWELAVIYVIWVGCTRLGQSAMLFFYYGKINMTFPFMMYLNQIAGASIKLFMFCRLPLQRWANRNNQKAGFGEYSEFQLGFAGYQTWLGILFVVGVSLILTGIMPLPPQIWGR